MFSDPLTKSGAVDLVAIWNAAMPGFRSRFPTQITFSVSTPNPAAPQGVADEWVPSRPYFFFVF
jgi:hypothetical protein